MALLKDHLIAHYKMNDNLATDVIIDETGNHNGAVKDATGTATSAFHSAAGKINLAQDLDGTDDYIEITDHADFTPALTPFSISVWLYMHDTASFMIASKGVWGTTGEWLFYMSSGNKIYFYLVDVSESAYIGRYYNTSLLAYKNQWVHLVCTYDGGILSSGIKLYLNGVRVDDIDYEALVFVSVENHIGNVYIGRSTTDYANGLIDNVMFFNKELTQLDINYLYNGSIGRENISAVGFELSRTGQHFSSHQEM